jgi:hypothetical protein
MIPYPPKPWTEATRIVGTGSRRGIDELRTRIPDVSRLPLYNDFCLTQAPDGSWHCIGILFEGTPDGGFRQDRLFHYSADSLGGRYTSDGYVDLGYGRTGGVWAPCVIWEGGRALMYYACLSAPVMTIRVAESADPRMRTWTRVHSGAEVIVQEPGARDPEVIRDPDANGYILYYVASVPDGDRVLNVVRARVSRDLVAWSEPRTVLGTPTGYIAAESVFVLRKGGYYYLWISGSDYNRISLYVSTDPMDFGDADANRIEEQPGHACEVVQAGGRYWMACVAVSSVPGLLSGPGIPVSQHDLEGVYLQPLEWKRATPEMLRRVVGTHGPRDHGASGPSR